MERPIRAGRLAGSYTLTHLGRDAVAGLTVAAVAVPQAMAYALIAHLLGQKDLDGVIREAKKTNTPAGSPSSSPTPTGRSSRGRASSNC